MTLGFKKAQCCPTETKDHRSVRASPFGCLIPLLLVSILTNATQAEKNVLLLMADDMNNWVGALGGHPQVKTPNIDAFAKKAVVFRNAHCSAPVCLSSRTSMLIGLRPATSGYLDNTSGFFRANPKYKDLVTLPQFFKNRGFYAAKGGKIFHLGVTEPEDSVSWNV
jgi:arylsulfatase A-like enzyme